MELKSQTRTVKIPECRNYKLSTQFTSYKNLVWASPGKPIRIFHWKYNKSQVPNTINPTVRDLLNGHGMVISVNLKPFLTYEGIGAKNNLWKFIKEILAQKLPFLCNFNCDFFAHSLHVLLRYQRRGRQTRIWKYNV